ncbi:hypothetical protein STTU_6352 [Streptomyces sp. Tu6071]|nr:hypothetical protein STTU_6352 [Streptomyces sp. Tu6071]
MTCFRGAFRAHGPAGPGREALAGRPDLCGSASPHDVG